MWYHDLHCVGGEKLWQAKKKVTCHLQVPSNVFWRHEMPFAFFAVFSMVLLHELGLARISHTWPEGSWCFHADTQFDDCASTLK
jgi:hypothetical protein